LTRSERGATLGVRVTKPTDYITPAGYQQLKAEFDELWRGERPRVTAEVGAAAALGDRSENAEYIYGKRRLREIDRRIRFLSKRMDAVRVVRPNGQHAGKVFFGAWVTLEDEDGVEKRYQIVGTDEFDVDAGKISVASPLARALLGKQEGDEVDVKAPRGDTSYSIVQIDYETEA
jgi:transcription elongation factor GreB